MNSPVSGYSGTPLPRKLGIQAGMRLLLRGAPEHYLPLLTPMPDGVLFVSTLDDAPQWVHLFVDRYAQLSAELPNLRAGMADDAVLWVSWPKKAAKLATDIREDDIRTLALPLGFVDVKVCAIDATWSGLKLVVRKELRGR